MQKILIIQTNSASQLMLDTALFRCMKQQLSNTELHLVTDAAFVHLVQHNPHLDRIHGYHNNLKTLQADFHLHGYDAIVDLQNDITSQQFISGLDAEHYYAKEPGLFSKIISTFRSKPHRIEHVFSITKDLGIQYDGNGPSFFIPEADKTTATDIPTSHSAGYICILLSSQINKNALGVLCERVNHPIILLGTEEDKATGDFVAQTDETKIYNAAGKFNFNETADLIRKSKLLIAELNEYFYIAVAYNIPGLVLLKHKKELADLRHAYSRTMMAKSNSPVFLYNKDFLHSQKTTELSDQIQRMLIGG